MIPIGTLLPISQHIATTALSHLKHSGCYEHGL